MLVDDHPLVRDGLCRILKQEPDLQVVGEADSGQAALDLVARLAIDVVLMDVRMPGIDGVEATRRLRATHPTVQVLVLSAFGEYASEALRAGAAGYVLKSAPIAQLLASVRAVALGSIAIQRSLFGGQPWRYVDISSPRALTDRETDIVRLISRGLTNRAIARQLEMAPRTADQHVHNLLVKLGVRSRAQAVRYAIEHGLNSLDTSPI